MDLYKDAGKKNLQWVALKYAVVTAPADISQAEFMLLQTRLDSVQEYRKSWNNNARQDNDEKPHHQKGQQGQQRGSSFNRVSPKRSVNDDAGPHFEWFKKAHPGEKG